MKTISLGGLSCRLVGGTDREGAGQGPLVILLHGFGAPGDDLVQLHRVIDAPAGTRFLFPEAPIALPPPYTGGRAWWNIDIAGLERAMATGEVRDLTRDVPDGLLAARAKVTALLAEATEKLTPSAIVLGGFSQGAMLACDVALHTDGKLAGIVLFSGTLVAEEEWGPRMAARKGLPVLQSHGREDPLLPFSIAERLRALLDAAGMVVTWIPFRGGHGIPPQALDGLGPWLKTALAV
jgi:phospholipase/carboxylesterase